MREGDAGKHGGQRAILARGPWVFTDGKGRATGETGDEWIAAVDLSSSFRVLSYSVAAPPQWGRGGGRGGGVGKQEVERGKQNASRTLEEQGAAACMGKKKKKNLNRLYTSVTWGIKHNKCEHNPHFNDKDDAILRQYLQELLICRVEIAASIALAPARLCVSTVH